jgi:hypothetical protein
MTAAMLVLQPIFEADLPPEQCAYRPGRNSLGYRIVTYADDFVIPCRRGKAEEALRQLRVIMGKLIRELRGRARIEAPVAVPQT